MQQLVTGLKQCAAAPQLSDEVLCVQQALEGCLLEQSSTPLGAYAVSQSRLVLHMCARRCARLWSWTALHLLKPAAWRCRADSFCVMCRLSTCFREQPLEERHIMQLASGIALTKAGQSQPRHLVCSGF